MWISYVLRHKTLSKLLYVPVNWWKRSIVILSWLQSIAHIRPSLSSSAISVNPSGRQKLGILLSCVCLCETTELWQSRSRIWRYGLRRTCLMWGLVSFFTFCYNCGCWCRKRPKISWNKLLSVSEPTYKFAGPCSAEHFQIRRLLNDTDLLDRGQYLLSKHAETEMLAYCSKSRHFWCCDPAKRLVSR